MSQIQFKHNNLSILTGWDRSQAYHFLLIEDENDAIIFDNLNLPDFKMSVAQIEETLQKFKVPFPEVIKRRLNFHRVTSAGNVIESFEYCARCFDYYGDRDDHSC